MRRLLRCRHPAWQALQVMLHTGRRALELREVLVGQTIKPVLSQVASGNNMGSFVNKVLDG